MVNEFCGFKHGVIGTDKMPSDTTLNNMKKVDLIKLLHTAQHNYETLMWFYNNAVKVNMSQLNNNGWIPCEKEMPKENEFVIASVHPNESVNGGNPVIITRYDSVSASYWHNGTIQAWMPLPVPYQKGADE